jgi:hypothetical protein
MLSSVITTFIRNYKEIPFLLIKKIYITEVFKEIWGVGEESLPQQAAHPDVRSAKTKRLDLVSH